MAEVSAGAESSVFGGVTCTAEEQGIPLEATLLPHHGEGGKDVVDLRVDHIALHLQPEPRSREAEKQRSREAEKQRYEYKQFTRFNHRENVFIVFFKD